VEVIANFAVYTFFEAKLMLNGTKLNLMPEKEIWLQYKEITVLVIKDHSLL
jgi:hypothetical protein